MHNRLAAERGQFMANRVLGLLKTLFNCAIHLDLYNVNPAAQLRAFEEPSRERFLHADELPRFWKAVEEETSETVRDFIKVALFTGQRRMNCLQMQWSQIDFARSTWSMAHTKTGRHEVSLTGEALKVLKQRFEDRGDSPYVFPGRHGREYLKDPMRQWREILKRAGIENLRIHDLRRSLAVGRPRRPQSHRDRQDPGPHTTRDHGNLQPPGIDSSSGRDGDRHHRDFARATKPKPATKKGAASMAKSKKPKAAEFRAAGLAVDL